MAIMTVCGPIAPDDLGVAMMHEHLAHDGTAWFTPHPDDHDRVLEHGRVELHHRGLLMRDPRYIRDNIRFRDRDEIIAEVADYRSVGGGSIVEVSNIGLNRNPLALRRISEATGVHVVAGCGHYVEHSWPAGIREQSVDELTAIIVRDLTEGIEGTDVRAGIIGEVGSSLPTTEAEERSIRAAARAYHATGAAITMHLGIGHEAWTAYRILHREEGVPVERIIMGHMDETPEPDYHRAIADLGVYVQFDTFGSEWYYDEWGNQEPRDTDRMAHLKLLIDAGYTRQLLVSQDICYKISLKAYGGWGYEHILRYIVPRLRAAGVSDESLQTILVENPKRVLDTPV